MSQPIAIKPHQPITTKAKHIKIKNKDISTQDY